MIWSFRINPPTSPGKANRTMPEACVVRVIRAEKCHAVRFCANPPWREAFRRPPAGALRLYGYACLLHRLSAPKWSIYFRRPRYTFQSTGMSRPPWINSRSRRPTETRNATARRERHRKIDSGLPLHHRKRPQRVRKRPSHEDHRKFPAKTMGRMPPGETTVLAKRHAWTRDQATREIGEVCPPEGLHQCMIRPRSTQSVMFEDHRANQFPASLIDTVEMIKTVEMIEGSLNRWTQIVERIVEPDPRVVKERRNSQQFRGRSIKIDLKINQVDSTMNMPSVGVQR